MNIRRDLKFFYFLLLFQPLWAQTFPNLQLSDQVYEPNIKTVLLYPAQNIADDPNRSLYPPVLNIESNQPLVAEFDDLSARYRGFRCKIKHCNADWTASTLNDIEFTYQYNDFAIEQYAASFNTKIPYYHYRFEVPRLKLSGNYVLVVYEDRRPAKLILSKRFMVYESRVSVVPNVRMSTGIMEQQTHQQVDFDINYGRYEIISPQEDMKVVVRQNARWNKTITTLKPSNVRVFDGRLEYRPFDLSNNFWAGNDFRWFDTRLARGSGMSVAEMQQLPEHTVAYLRPDSPSGSGGVFLQANDLNGQFIIENKEASNNALEADYLNIVFTLKMPELTDAQVFVNGAFCQWLTTDANLMGYDPATGAYKASIFVKQGVVNYDYLIMKDKQPDERTIEGSYSASTNDYEIFVYHRPPAARSDLLIGYRLVEFGRK